MKSYSAAARALGVSVVGLFLIQGTPVGQRLASLWGSSSEDDLLFNAESPFQNEALLSVDTVKSDSEAPVSPQPAVVNEEKFGHTVKKGATIASLWRDIKGAPRAVHSFISAFSSKHPKLKAGEVVEVTRKGDEIVELRRDLGDGATLIITGGSDEGYEHRVEQAKVSVKERTVSGTISSSLVEAARGVNLPYSVVDDFVDLLAERVEFRKDLQPGDTFTVLYDERVLEDGKVLDTGVIKAASIVLSGKMFAVVRDVGPDGTARYFDERGEMPTKAFLRYPVQFTRIGSVFSTARFHPILHIRRPHNGVDFSAPIGTPVRTVGDGVVVFSGYTSSTGYMVKVSHDSRYTTEYMHLSKISSSARKGARVTRGSVIGNVGSTGLSSGPHLHFGLFDHGKYVDPQKAKVIQSAPDMKAPKQVFARIAEMRKTHQSMNVAFATNSAKKKA